MLETFIPQASTYASEVDGLINMVGAFVGFWFVLSFGTFIWLIFRFRERNVESAEYITGELKHQKRWITIPHLLVLVCDVFIIVGAVQVWYNIKQYLPEAEQTVRVTGQQWTWTFQHPGPDGKIDTADDIATVNELHVQKGVKYHYKLESVDVLHDFSVPVFRLKQDAIPGRIITGWFEPTLEGEYDVQCAEICGIGHGLMGARIFIESEEKHAAWVASESPVQLAAVTNPQRAIQE